MAEREFVQSVWLEWGASIGPSWGAIILVLVALTGGVFLWRFGATGSARVRVSLVVLRVAALTLLCFLLLRPVLVQTVMDKSESVVAVLYDDSDSMNVLDSNGESRATRMLNALGEKGNAFAQALDAQSHRVEYRIGATARPLDTPVNLRFDAGVTDFLGAIRSVAADNHRLALYAIIVVSDGAQSAEGSAQDFEALATIGVPVYTVGVGEPRWRDLALGEVSLSRSYMDDAPATIGAQVEAEGFADEVLVVEVLQDDRVVASEERTVSMDSTEQQVRLEVPLDGRGWQKFDVRVRPKNDGIGETEFVSQNNQRALLLDHREKAYRVLYFGGRPNWQNKFIRRALESDPEVQLSSLVRVSGAEKGFTFRGRGSSLGNPLFQGVEGKRNLPRYDEAVFLRLGLGADELAGGYPTKATELYPFHLVIWGDIEPDFFATPQLVLTRDAVSERGASFLLMGGPGTSSAAFFRTVMAPLLPTMPRVTDGPSEDNSARIEPSAEAFLSGAWALHADMEEHQRTWEALPELPDIREPGPARIGATVLATARSSDSGREEPPFFVWQSYGLGRSALLATGETWPWHLQTEMDNDAHERLWRQMVRSLVRTVPDPITMVSEPGEVVVGATSALVWTIRDETFESVVGGTFHAVVTEHDGTSTTLPALEVLEMPGTYRVEFAPSQIGLHKVRLEGENADAEPVAATESAFLVVSDRREWRNPKFDDAVLRDIAEQTGGAYFSLDELQDVPAALAMQEGQKLRHDRFPIWHRPPFYIALLLFIALEWIIRRRAGQP